MANQTETYLSGILEKMTLEEKASLCSGGNNFLTKGIERLKIPSLNLNDGPHGSRKEKPDNNSGDMYFTHDATCFPNMCALGCSFDEELVFKVGEQLSLEAERLGTDVILGPGINIKRSPLCGRNFEYISEDPYLAGKLGAAYVKGVQTRNVSACIKHFAVNNQEYERMTVSANVDERALHEIYLKPFEIAVKEGKPHAVMCAYNRLNETYCAENMFLLTETLRNEWNFDGIVISDWGAVNDRIKSLISGLDLEMPGCIKNDEEIVAAVKENRLSEKTLNISVLRLLKFILMLKGKPQETLTQETLISNHSFARKAAAECAVLLKNNNSLLPLKKKKNYAIIGEFSNSMRFQGGGSAKVNTSMIDTPLQEISLIADSYIEYAKGYDLSSDKVSNTLIREAVEIAREKDAVILMAGLPEHYESEGYDRENLKLPLSQLKLIEEVSKVNKNIVIVLVNGGAVEMPFEFCVSSILEMYLGGESAGGALADILFGKVSPSGRLAESFPVCLEHNPSYLNYPGFNNSVNYLESIFVGYRYYTTKKISTLFPFGFGLSYSTFSYSKLELEKTDSEQIKVKFTVKNTGNIAAKEVIQIYISKQNGKISAPKRELKRFNKILLAADEAKELEYILEKSDFQIYLNGWKIEPAQYSIEVCANSEKVLLAKSIFIEGDDIISEITINTTPNQLLTLKNGNTLLEEILLEMKNISGINFHPKNMKVALSRKFFMDTPLRIVKNYFGDKISMEQLLILIANIKKNT